MNKQGKTTLAGVMCCLLLAGCAATAPYPVEWTEVLADDEWCRQPSGSFGNLPVASSESAVEGSRLLLSEIFFGPLLRGFEVTHLSFDTLDSGELRIRPWVGDTGLLEERIIAPAAERCGRERWQVKSGWETSPYDTAYLAFWTAGSLLPVASQAYFSLERDAEGQLVVHAIARTAGVALYFIPFRTRVADAWYAYAPQPSKELPDAE